MNMKPKALQTLRPNAEWVLRGDELEWLDAEQTQPTEAEITAKIAELEAAEPMRLLRLERNQRLANTDWWASSDLTMTNEQREYRQALRDITETYTSLDDVVWPEVPNE
jgi:hypothetical protein